MHFINIRTTESGSGYDHADILKDHINCMAKCHPINTEEFQVEAEGDPAPIAVPPRAISRFAPRATCNPAPNWGKVSQPTFILIFNLTPIRNFW